MRVRLLCLSLLSMLFLLPATAAAGEPGVPSRKFQKEIDKAIKNGAKWLQTQQKLNGSVGGVAHSGDTHYEIGVSALVGLALLHGGVKPGEESVDTILAYCRKKDDLRGDTGARTTYDTGVLLMFVIEYYRPKTKKKPDKGHTATKDAVKNPCSLPRDIRAWVRNMAKWLAGQQQTSGGWGYPQNRWDYSNTQYALLGLRAAKDCGIPIDPKVWLKALNHALSFQEETGPKVNRVLKASGKGQKDYVFDAGDKARGWGYMESARNPTGSMTTAGIAILAICHDALLKPRRFKPYTDQLKNKTTQSVQDGFAWLDMWFTVTKNPGENAPNWHYYYLYGLERASVFGGRDLIGEHDWYLTGARYLVDAQNKDGRWSTGALGGKEYEASDVVDTAWAILFLARATRPLDPIRPPTVTPTPKDGG